MNLRSIFSSRRRRTVQLASYSRDAADTLIEPGVFPLVDALNVPGVCETIASCEGHLSLTSRTFYNRPYVFFKAPVELVRAISRIEDVNKPTSLLTYYHWVIQGHFYPETKELVWTLETQDAFMLSNWNRQQIDEDCQTLANHVQDCVVNFNRRDLAA